MSQIFRWQSTIPQSMTWKRYYLRLRIYTLNLIMCCYLSRSLPINSPPFSTLPCAPRGWPVWTIPANSRALWLPVVFTNREFQQEVVESRLKLEYIFPCLPPTGSFQAGFDLSLKPWRLLCTTLSFQILVIASPSCLFRNKWWW